MKAAIYVRVSSDEQIKGFSLEKQEETCMDFLKKEGHELYHVYCDPGLSAKDTNRPELQKMLAEIPRKSFDMIVVWNSDRLTRDVIDGLTMVKTLFNKYDIKFASITEDIDTSTPDGMMMFTMRLMMAQRERERIGERVSMGQAKKASLGRRVSLGDIYGYDKVDGKLVINEVEAAVVNKMFEWYVHKGWGYAKIAAALNDGPDKTPAKHTDWKPVTIKGILRNITYIGKNIWTPKRGEPIITIGEHKPILTDELYYLAQTQLKRRFSGEMSRSSYSYPFSSIVKCGECGGSYTAYYTKKPVDKNAYCNYRCSNKKGGLCKASDIAQLKLEKLFFTHFAKLPIIQSSELVLDAVDQIQAFEKERKRIAKEIDKLEKRKNNLLADLGDRIISRDDYKNMMEETNKNLTKLRKELEIIDVPEVAASISPGEMMDMVENLYEDWEYTDDEDRKFLIQAMFKRIVIKKENNEWTIKEIDPA